MQLHKRVGIITVVISALLAVFGLVISTNVCAASSPYLTQLSTAVFFCQEIRFSLTDNPFDAFDPVTFLFNEKTFALPFRHLTFLCITFGAVGCLWIFEVLPVPFRNKAAAPAKL